MQRRDQPTAAETVVGVEEIQSLAVAEVAKGLDPTCLRLLEGHRILQRSGKIQRSVVEQIHQDLPVGAVHQNSAAAALLLLEQTMPVAFAAALTSVVAAAVCQRQREQAAGQAWQ